MFRRYFLWFFPSFFAVTVSAQSSRGNYYMDSLQQGLSHAGTPFNKIMYLAQLSAAAFNDPVQSESYVNQAVEVAELSRDRRLMAMVYLFKGKRYMNTPGLSDHLDQALGNFHRVEEIARTNDLTTFLSASYDQQARAWLLKGDRQKALFYSNQALSIAGNTDIDTAKMRGYLSMGYTYMSMDEKLLSFRNFLEAQAIAEKSGKDELLKSSYTGLSDFYASIHAYDTAIDYRMKVYGLDRKSWSPQEIITDEYQMGDLFWKNKQPELAEAMYEHAVKLADTLHYDLLKWDPYFRMFNMYLNNNQYVKSLKYLESHAELLTFLQNVGYQYFVDQIYGMSYTEKKNFDSAFFYLHRAEPNVEAVANPEGRYDFYKVFGDYYMRKNEFPSAIGYYTKAYAIAEKVGDLEWQESTAQLLDSIYGVSGNYQLARLYNIKYHLFRDSIRDLSRETELRKMEVENENQRRERLAKEEEARVEHRHNTQYMGFTLGLVALFIALVMLGWLAVPAGVIRALGFVSFIFLFEFVILLADKSIVRWTHEEPWKVLGIKIGLAAVLVPLHHWLEHKVIHYLSHRKKKVQEIKDPSPAV